MKADALTTEFEAAAAAALCTALKSDLETLHAGSSAPGAIDK